MVVESTTFRAYGPVQLSKYTLETGTIKKSDPVNKLFRSNWCAPVTANSLILNLGTFAAANMLFYMCLTRQLLNKKPNSELLVWKFVMRPIPTAFFTIYNLQH